ncbi:MAG: glycosyltransferase family 2 protein [Bacteroidia bacterium]|nr:glycosyltransferase family 2 protein [Bacteroidia bacterium]
MPCIYILILNWNGHTDTIECLESLLKIDYPYYRIVLIDNGSEKDSFDIILNWCDIINLRYISYDKAAAIVGGTAAGEAEIKGLKGNECIIIIANEENIGFAAGNNIGIDYASKKGAGYVLLLNNDTVVQKDFLLPMVDKLLSEESVKAVTGQIRYFEPDDIIWNCGGNISALGRINYLYPSANIKTVPQEGSETVTFISGCALLFDYRATGKLTERFFYGEEDVEFAMRLKKSGYKMACCFNSVIYHKVGRSIDKTSLQTIGKVYIFYLNRFINFKDYFPYLKWQLWRIFYLFYIMFLITVKYKQPLNKAVYTGRRLLADSSRLNRVSKEFFMNAISMF